MSAENPTTNRHDPEFVPIDLDYGDPKFFVKPPKDKEDLIILLRIKIDQLSAMTSIASDEEYFGSLNDLTRAKYLYALAHITDECRALARHL